MAHSREDEDMQTTFEIEDEALDVQQDAPEVFPENAATDRQIEFARDLYRQLKQAGEDAANLEGWGEQGERAKRDKGDMSALIDDMLERIDELGRPATDRQMNYVRALLSEIPQTVRDERDLDDAVDAVRTRDEASMMIDRLHAVKRETRDTVADEQGLEGAHRVGDTIYRVQRAVHGSGKLYAKAWDPATESWDYRGRRPLAKMGPETRLTAEEAAAFGALYGVCVFCASPLTDERSIAVGYGPVCAENHGLPWG